MDGKALILMVVVIGLGLGCTIADEINKDACRHISFLESCDECCQEKGFGFYKFEQYFGCQCSKSDVGGTLTAIQQYPSTKVNYLIDSELCKDKHYYFNDPVKCFNCCYREYDFSLYTPNGCKCSNSNVKGMMFNSTKTQFAMSAEEDKEVDGRTICSHSASKSRKNYIEDCYACCAEHGFRYYNFVNSCVCGTSDNLGTLTAVPHFPLIDEKFCRIVAIGKRKPDSEKCSQCCARRYQFSLFNEKGCKCSNINAKGMMYNSTETQFLTIVKDKEVDGGTICSHSASKSRKNYIKDCYACCAGHGFRYYNFVDSCKCGTSDNLETMIAVP